MTHKLDQAEKPANAISPSAFEGSMEPGSVQSGGSTDSPATQEQQLQEEINDCKDKSRGIPHSVRDQIADGNVQRGRNARSKPSMEEFVHEKGQRMEDEGSNSALKEMNDNDEVSSEEEEDHEDDESSQSEGSEPESTSINSFRRLFKSERPSEAETKTKMGNLREALADSYLREGRKILLHGYLHIQIIRARKLRNLDCMRGCHNAFPARVCFCLAENVSDPYVTVHAGKSRLIKTSIIFDDLNPEWETEYFLPVAHPIEKLEFRVKDWDVMSDELIGSAYLPVSDLIRFGANGKLQRTGVHRVVHLDKKVSHGAFEYYVEYVPKQMMHPTLVDKDIVKAGMTVPGVYFKPREDNHVKLYIDADDKCAEYENESVAYGETGSQTWNANQLWKDIYGSLCDAKHFIYIVGWSVDYRQSLLRGEDLKRARKKMENGKDDYSSFLGQLLEQKAAEGVNVNLLVWDDQTSTMLMDGVVGTRDEQLRHYFNAADSNVTLRLVPMAASHTHLFKRLRQSVFFTHHQKCVITDTPAKELVAYVGGIDLTFGRYDDGSYALFRTLGSIHREDFHNACFDVNQENGPRQPWHDIHSCIQGPVVLDLIENFKERWIGQGGLEAELTDLQEAELNATAEGVENTQDAWSAQLFRSIDNRTAKLKYTDVQPIKFDDIEGVKFETEGTKQKAQAKREQLMEKLLKTGKEYERSFVGETLEGFNITCPLHFKRQLRIDNSAHAGLVHHIRNAQHSIYIENQYFLSSSFLWEENRTPLCCNLIAAEITWKICEKIEAGERFAAYIVIPMWPEGISEAKSVQDILFYQYQTMQCMYVRIEAALRRHKEQLKKAGKEDEVANIEATDYLNFYCLVNRETQQCDTDHESRSSPTLLNVTRRHPVYCHSKMTIVDDAVAIVGSANINQRSLDGNRDSELLVGMWQPAYLASEECVAQGQVHAFRMHCFTHLTGVIEEIFRNPSSLECVHRVNEIAEETWQLYVQDEVCDLRSYLVPYPVKVGAGGKLLSKTADGEFPDTHGNILGGKPGLPQYLTT